MSALMVIMRVRVSVLTIALGSMCIIEFGHAQSPPFTGADKDTLLFSACMPGGGLPEHIKKAWANEILQKVGSDFTRARVTLSALGDAGSELKLARLNMIANDIHLRMQAQSARSKRLIFTLELIDWNSQQMPGVPECGELRVSLQVRSGAFDTSKYD